LSFECSHLDEDEHQEHDDRNCDVDDDTDEEGEGDTEDDNEVSPSVLGSLSMELQLLSVKNFIQTKLHYSQRSLRAYRSHLLVLCLSTNLPNPIE
jgi:hypothetical protein